MQEASPLALPPDELIDRVAGAFTNEDAEDQRRQFLEYGRRSLEDLERALAAIGDRLEAHRRILEFGCGCGRIMRWMQPLAQTSTLVGTDIDTRAIEWARTELTFASFDVNAGLPPTRYADGEFDLILNHSVFTHLDADYQDHWLAELRRITAPGGVLVLSIHGEHAFRASEQQLSPDAPELRRWRETLERDGILFVSDDGYVGGPFPDFYHTTFHAPWYVFEHWSEWFEVLALLPRSALDYQDQVVLRRPLDPDAASEPVRARPQRSLGGDAPTAAAHAQAGRGVEGILEPNATASRFGEIGLLARRALFRAARPVLHAQLRVDRELSNRLDRVEEQLDERMPPLVRVALVQQAERIDRLERELGEALRSTPDAARGPAPDVALRPEPDPRPRRPAEP